MFSQQKWTLNLSNTSSLFYMWPFLVYIVHCSLLLLSRYGALLALNSKTCLLVIWLKKSCAYFLPIFFFLSAHKLPEGAEGAEGSWRWVTCGINLVCALSVGLIGWKTPAVTVGKFVTPWCWWGGECWTDVSYLLHGWEKVQILPVAWFSANLQVAWINVVQITINLFHSYQLQQSH